MPSELKWIYILDDDFKWSCGRTFPEVLYRFADKNGTLRLELIQNGGIRIPAGYAWDGCSPKFAIWDIMIGVPDGVPNHNTKKPKAYYASLVHDSLYQFLDVGLPITKEEADKIFLKLLERDDFSPRKIYYYAVVIFGNCFRHITKWKRGYKHGRRL